MNDKEKLFYHVEGRAAEHNRGRMYLVRSIFICIEE